MQSESLTQSKTEVPQKLANGEIVLINGAFFKVKVEPGKGGLVTTLEPTGDGKLSKLPWRIVQHNYQGKWVPAIIDDKERVVALVFGKDDAQRDANAVALLQAHLYQAEPKAA